MVLPREFLELLELSLRLRMNDRLGMLDLLFLPLVEDTEGATVVPYGRSGMGVDVSGGTSISPIVSIRSSSEPNDNSSSSPKDWASTCLRRALDCRLDRELDGMI